MLKITSSQKLLLSQLGGGTAVVLAGLNEVAPLIHAQGWALPHWATVVFAIAAYFSHPPQAKVPEDD